MDAHQTTAGWVDRYHQQAAERQHLAGQEAALREIGIDLSPRRALAQRAGRAMTYLGTRLVTMGERLECPDLTITGKQRQPQATA